MLGKPLEIIYFIPSVNPSLAVKSGSLIKKIKIAKTFCEVRNATENGLEGLEALASALDN